MTDRAELLEAALDSLAGGHCAGRHGGPDRLLEPRRGGHYRVCERGSAVAADSRALEPLLCRAAAGRGIGRGAVQAGHGALVHLKHKLGHDVPAMLRTLVLRDGLGGRIGMAVVFHPAESLDALPHGECGDGSERGGQPGGVLRTGWRRSSRTSRRAAQPFGVLWITVDQAHDLRKTHGAGACDAMLEKVERALANGLRPAEEMGRWGDDEFLVLSHERTPEMLAAHAQVLAGLARTADFRWWGDRISLTVSIGAAQAERDGSLAELLERAKAAMLSSFHAGGNQITSAPGGQECSPS